MSNNTYFLKKQYRYIRAIMILSALCCVLFFLTGQAHSTYINKPSLNISGDFSINSDVTETVISTVTLNNAMSGVTQMRFGNTIAERDSAAWETYATTRSWTLSAGFGKKTIYASFRNAGGDIVSLSDDITIETTPTLPHRTGLTIWLDGEDTSTISESGGMVSGWKDKSGNNYHALQDTTTEQPLIMSDTMTFDGNSDYFYIQDKHYINTDPLDGLLVCTVFKTTNTNNSIFGNWSFLDFDRSEWFNFYNGGSGIGFSYMGTGIRDNSVTGVGVNDNQLHVTCASYDNTIVNDTLISVDGVVGYDQNVEPTGAQIGVGQSTRYGFVGEGSEASSQDGGRNRIYYDGGIAEIVYFDTPIDVGYREDIECYLGEKWGVSISGCGYTSFPIATVEYVPETVTENPVVATLTNSSSPITITNNGGSNTYTFTNNGTFTFEYEDASGNPGSTTATVDWIVDLTAPTITSSSPADNALLPGGTHDIIFNYTDNIVGVDASSAVLTLHEWNGSAWGADVSGSYISTGGQSVSTSQALYPLLNAPLGKYKAEFTLKDLSGNTVVHELFFYIDVPEFIISEDIINIGVIDAVSNNFAPSVTLTVKTIGSPYKIYMNTTTPLEYTPHVLPFYNGTHGIGYNTASDGTLSPFATDTLVGSGVQNINTNGLHNVTMHTVDIGGIHEATQIAGTYIGEIRFRIEYDY